MATSDAGRSPYVGPRSFEVGEPLFGRARELTELRYLLLAERVVLLYSPSGAGKTSLLQAGLIPLMRERFDVWRPTRVSDPPPPGVPAGTNRHVLSAMLGFEQGIPEALRRPPSALAGLRLAEYVAGRVREPEAPDQVLLIFDQFEEILTVDPHGLAARQAFFGQLGELLLDPKVWALFAIREDYLAPLLPHVKAVPTRLRTRYRIDLLGQDAAREAIVRPAAEAGRAWSEAAVDKLIRDLATVKIQQADGQFVDEVGRYIEPMQLQVVCRGLWERMPADDLRIDPEDIEAFANVTHALATYYATAVRRASGGDPAIERTIREWVGDRLIASHGIRTPVLKTPGASSGLANFLIKNLIDRHIVRADHRGGVVWFELAHDRLVGPVRVDNERWVRENLQPMQVQAALWEQQDRPAALLLSEAALVGAEKWAAGQPALAEPDRSFLAASQAARDHTRAVRDAQAQALKAAQELAASEVRAAARQRRLTWIVGTLGLLSVILSVASYLQRREAVEQTSRAESAEQTVVQKSRIAEVYKYADDPTTQAIVLREFTANEQDEEWWRWTRGLRQRPTAKSVLEHPSPVRTAAWAPDGQHVVTAAGKQAWVWSLDRSPPPPPLEHDTAVRIAMYSPKTGRVLTVASDHKVRLWPAGAATGTVIAEHRDTIHAVAFSRDERHIVTASRDGTAKISPTDGSGSVTLGGHTDAVVAAAFTNDGQRVVTGSHDRTARVWQVDGTPIATLGGGTPPIGHKDAVVAVAFSPKGGFVATASDDRTALIWRYDGVGGPQLLASHADRLTSIAIANDARTVATTAWDKTARLCPIDLTSRAAAPNPNGCVALSGHTDIVTSAEFSRDSRWLVTASLDRTARVWRTDLSALPVVLGGHGDRVVTAQFSPDEKNRRIVTASWDGKARIWRSDGIDSPVVLTAHADRVNASAFSPDGTRFVTGSWDKKARAWNLDGEFTEISHEQSVRGVAFSPDGVHAATVAKDGAVRLWDLAAPDRAPVRLTDTGQHPVANTVRFSAGGVHVATGFADGTLRVWQVADRRAIAGFRGHTKAIHTVGFAPKDDAILVSTSEDGTARVWRIGQTTAQVAAVQHGDAVITAAFSPDGARVASASRDADIRVWRADGSGEPDQLRREHTSTIRTIAFSPDGARFVTASDDLSARVWSDLHGPSIALENHGAEVLGAWFSDDAHVITVAADNVVRVWNADGTGDAEVLAGPKEWITAAAYSKQAGRLLTTSSAGSVYLWTLFSPSDYTDHLWRATSYCFPAAVRVKNLGESEADAAENHRLCRERVAEYAEHGAY